VKSTLASIRSFVDLVIEVTEIDDTPELRKKILRNVRKSILEDERIAPDRIRDAYIQTIDDEITSI